MALVLNAAVLAVLLLGSIAFLTKGKYWGVANASSTKKGSKGPSIQSAEEAKARDIVAKAAESSKNCVVFFGSQTGTAEGFATRLMEEGKNRFGLETMIADLKSYDYKNLDAFPEDSIAMFVMATCGDGDPTDNAVQFWETITMEDAVFSKATDPPLQNLRFCIFGLGDNSYEHFNAMGRKLNAALEKLGAQRIGSAGEGDDGSDGLNDAYLAWKEPMWAALVERMGLEEREGVEPDLAPMVKKVL